MGPRVLYPLHLCPILKNLSMQHISGYNLIQGAIGCSVASPLGFALGMKRDFSSCEAARFKTESSLARQMEFSCAVVAGVSLPRVFVIEDFRRS